ARLPAGAVGSDRGPLGRTFLPRSTTSPDRRRAPALTHREAERIPSTEYGAAPMPGSGGRTYVMTTQRPLIVGILLAIVLVGSGCASMEQPKGTVVPITKENLASLAGVWNGWAYAGANGFPGELTLRQDGYFNNSVGAFTSTGTFQLQNG